jgi:hypothetical protein
MPIAANKTMPSYRGTGGRSAKMTAMPDDSRLGTPSR